MKILTKTEFIKQYAKVVYEYTGEWLTSAFLNDAYARYLKCES